MIFFTFYFCTILVIKLFNAYTIVITWQIINLFCPEGVTLSNINDETLAAFEEYRINLTNICHELYEFGINENCQRKKEHEIFLGVIQAAQDSVRDDARQLI